MTQNDQSASSTKTGLKIGPGTKLRAFLGGQKWGGATTKKQKTKTKSGRRCRWAFSSPQFCAKMTQKVSTIDQQCAKVVNSGKSH